MLFSSRLVVGDGEQDVRDAGLWSRRDAVAKLRDYRTAWTALRDQMDDVGRLGGLSQLCVQAVQTLSLLLCAVQSVLCCLQVGG